MLENFIYAQKETLYQEQYDVGNISDESITLVEEDGGIWNRGHRFGGMTPEEKDKLNIILSVGDGTKFLANNGQYVEISGGSEPYIWDGTTSETIFAELKAAVEDNRSIILPSDAQYNPYQYTIVFSSAQEILGTIYLQGNVAGIDRTIFVTFDSIGSFVNANLLPKENSGGIDYNMFPGYNNWGELSSNITPYFQHNHEIYDETNSCYEYQGDFTFGDTVYTVTFPDTVKWSTDSVLDYKANHTYQFKIVNNLGVMKEFANS